MQFFTEAIRKSLPKPRSTEEIPIEEKQIVCKFFNPCGVGTWYVVEGEEDEGDFLFWGLVDLHEKEFGYFSLNELSQLRLPFGMKIERDLHFKNRKIGDVCEG